MQIAKINDWFLQRGSNKKTCGHNGGPRSLSGLDTSASVDRLREAETNLHTVVSQEKANIYTQNLGLHYSLCKPILQRHVKYSSICSDGTSVWHARGKLIIKQWNYSGLHRKTHANDSSDGSRASPASSSLLFSAVIWGRQVEGMP